MWADFFSIETTNKIPEHATKNQFLGFFGVSALELGPMTKDSKSPVSGEILVTANVPLFLPINVNHFASTGVFQSYFCSYHSF